MTSVPRPATLVDWMLVLFAWVSAALGLWLVVVDPVAVWRDRLLNVDAALCAIFLLAICVRWLRFRIGWIYLRKHWWEALSVVPFLALESWHWVGYVVLFARVLRVVDRTDNVFGDKITGSIVGHFSAPIVEVIKRPITIAVLDEVIDVIRAGHYAANVSAALEENRVELEALILDLIRKDQAAGKLRRVPFHDDVVRLISDTVFRIVHGALDDPRVHELIDDIIRNSATQLRASVRLGVRD